MDDKPLKITKVDSDETPTKTEKALVTGYKPVEGGKKRKTIKTYPRGILKTAKIKPVSDPAKHPPIKKSHRKHTIRLLSDSTVSHRRKTIKKKVSKMPDSKVRDIAIKSGLSNGNAPSKLLREMVEGGMIAGFISSE
jgi:hypothetical protein